MLFQLQQNYNFCLLMSHSLSADRRRQSAQRKARNTTNKSSAKNLYSFSKSDRFPKKMYKSHAEFRFYDIEMKKFDKKIGFTTSKRSSIFNNNNGVPPPTKYSAKLLDFNQKKINIQFKNNRQECKANCVFPSNPNPGPGQYNPNDTTKYKSLYYSLRKKYVNTNQVKPQPTPGPSAYKIQSTLLDKNKFLSIYVRKNSTKICPSRTVYSTKQQKDQDRSTNLFRGRNYTQASQTAYITHKGQRILRKSGPSAITTRQRRRFQTQAKQVTPGPGQYQISSQFPDLQIQV